MNEDIVSVRILVAFGSARDRHLLHQAADTAPFPVTIIEGDGVDTARNLLAANEIDVAFLDATVAPIDLTSFIASARSVPRPPFVILVAAAPSQASEFKAGGMAPDGIVNKPARIEQAKTLIDRCIRLCLPSRVLIVDDSDNMRRIVRKLLTGIRFVLEIKEAKDGIDALRQIDDGKFDLVLLDDIMPGLNGIETLSEIKRQYPRTRVVMMTSTHDGTIIERARAAGAVAFLKKPFYPADIDAVLLNFYGLRPPS